MATIVLLGLAGLQLVLPSSTRLPPQPDLVPRRAHEPSPPQAPDFPSVLQDPIFAPDRKPDDTAIPVAGGMSGFTVLGIATGENTATALVKGPDGTIQRVHPGDEEDGWRLVNIALDGLTFERNNERRILMLTKVAPPPPSPPPAAASDDTTDKTNEDDQ